MKLLNNVKFLYVVFIFTLLNVSLFIYRKDFQSILIFIVSCIAIYLINKNMIVVLGLSILFVDTLGIVRIFKKEGFEDEDDTDKKSHKIENMHDSDSESDNENQYMQNKHVIKKIKKMNPNILDSLNKLNSIDIKEINEYIDSLKDAIDA